MFFELTNCLFVHSAVILITKVWRVSYQTTSQSWNISRACKPILYSLINCKCQKRFIHIYFPMFQKLESKQHSWRNTCIAWKHYKIGSSVSESVRLLIFLHPIFSILNPCASLQGPLLQFFQWIYPWNHRRINIAADSVRSSTCCLIFVWVHVIHAVSYCRNLNGNSLSGKVPAAVGGMLLHRVRFK